MNPWEGKQMWIWQLNQAGTPQSVVDKAVSDGLSGLLVKAWDGGNYWSQIEAITPLAKAAGLVVGAWGYSYGKNPTGEAAAAERAINAGVDWLVLDAEVEYETAAGAEMALTLGNTFRQRFKVPIGYTSFGIAQYHSRFPFRQFSGWCDVVLPQIYWGDFNMTVIRAMQLSLEGFQQYGLPIAPVGQSYNTVTKEDILLFGQLAKEKGLSGVSFWSWQHATPLMWKGIANIPYKKEVIAVSDWAKQSWDKAVARGIFDGTNPQDQVTREMMAVLIDRLGLLDYSNMPQDMVNKLKEAGLISNDHPTTARVTWGELSVVIDNLLQKVNKA